MPEKKRKVKLVVYLSKEVHDRIIEIALEWINATRRFRGVISEVVEDCIREHFGLPNREKK